MPIPVRAEDINASWLSESLGEQVDACELESTHEGTTGRAVIWIEHNSQSLPARLFVKLPPTNVDQQAFVMEAGMGMREARFYRELGGELSVRTPRCYHSDYDESGRSYIMLLEHLEDSDCQFRPARQYSYTWLQAVMQEFAALHAAFWDSPRFEDELAWLQSPQAGSIGVRLIESALSAHGDALPSIFSELSHLYLDHHQAIHGLWQHGTPTVQHGDPHDGNQFLDGERPGFLDWGVVARGPGMRDVGYFLAGIVRAEDIDRVPELLEVYREGLKRAGVEQPPDSDELWQQYQWHAMYGWLACATTLGAGETMQPSRYILAALEKMHPTLAAHDVVAAVRAELV